MTGERKLRNRKRRASKGRAIRASDLVYDTLDSARRGRSWDALLRRMLGLPDRAGNPQPLVEGVLEVHSGAFLLRGESSWKQVEEQATKMAVRIAQNKNVRCELPVKMREVR